MLEVQLKYQVVPNEVKKTWNEHAIQGLIIVSLTLHISLTFLGYIRRYNRNTVMRIILWCFYNLAYAIVTISLSITAQSVVETSNNSQDQKSITREFMSLWAQFLFLHLGGQDTITAYSLEDSELWLRELAVTLFQSGVALYILLLSLPGCSNLPLLSIFVYIAGCIKCFERIRSLRLANIEHLRESMLGAADPGPDYVKFLEDYLLKKSPGFTVRVEEVADHPLPITHAYSETVGDEILEAYNQFHTFKRLFVGLILTYEDRNRSTSFIRHLDSSQAFHAMEIELGFVYDMLYTKASVIYTKKGLIRRVVGVILLLLVLVGFHFHSDKYHYLFIDKVITYLVIAAELSKEMFSVVSMLLSDRVYIWLKQNNYTLISSFLNRARKQRWSNSFGQLNLLNVALNEDPSCFVTQEFFGVRKYLTQQRYQTHSEVSFNLKNMIYTHFLKFVEQSSDPKGLRIHKGAYSLQKNGVRDLLWSINDVAFEQSILIWHIATTLCYYSDINDPMEINRIESKNMSEYVVNLLISHPEMLPDGIGMMRYRDTCAEAIRFFKMKSPINEICEACTKLLEVRCEELLPSVVKGDQSKSVLFDGCRLALALRKIKSREKMWKVMSEVWIEILAFAAADCRVFYHSQQLGRGGEFLTHVWLLMAHLGMTDHFQVSHGHARARFNVS
ncbi:hypothetical protein LXL04_015239 [Taraxacum kok-saghyz]